MKDVIRANFDKYKQQAACLIAFSIPLKLAIAYILLVPTILVWLYLNRREISIQIDRLGEFVGPLLSLVIIMFCSSLVGFDPIHSITSLFSLTFFIFVIPFFAEIGTRENRINILLSLVLGQSIAAAHSVLAVTLPFSIPNLFLGAVTESGQLTLTIIVLIGIITYFRRDIKSNATERWSSSLISIGALSWFTSIMVLAFGAPLHTEISRYALGVATLIYALFIPLNIYRKNWKAKREIAILELTISTALPILTAALVINLKRGPWAGVLIAGSVFLLLTARRFFIPLVCSVILIFATLTPVRERLYKSYEHFFITGGRSEIWEIGLELATRYPLGIGYNNSRVLSTYSTDIPKELQHFHNNLLNIGVEAGWLGLLVYLYWIALLLRRSFLNNGPDRIIFLSLGCALLSWQIAGFMEYNFGDSEVVQLAFLVIGILGSSVMNQNEAAQSRMQSSSSSQQELYRPASSA